MRHIGATFIIHQNRIKRLIIKSDIISLTTYYYKYLYFLWTWKQYLNFRNNLFIPNVFELIINSGYFHISKIDSGCLLIYNTACFRNSRLLLDLYFLFIINAGFNVGINVLWTGLYRPAKPDNNIATMSKLTFWLLLNA